MAEEPRLSHVGSGSALCLHASPLSPTSLSPPPLLPRSPRSRSKSICLVQVRPGDDWTLHLHVGTPVRLFPRSQGWTLWLVSHPVNTWIFCPPSWPPSIPLFSLPLQPPAQGLMDRPMAPPPPPHLSLPPPTAYLKSPPTQSKFARCFCAFDHHRESNNPNMFLTKLTPSCTVCVLPLKIPLLGVCYPVWYVFWAIGSKFEQTQTFNSVPFPLRVNRSERQSWWQLRMSEQSLPHQERVLVVHQRTWGLTRDWGETRPRMFGNFSRLYTCFSPPPTNISDVFGQMSTTATTYKTVNEHLRFQTQNKTHLDLNNDCK